MHDYLDQEIIAKLKLCKTVIAQPDLWAKVNQIWVRQLPRVINHRNLILLWQRLALAILILFLSGAGLVLAAEKSSPGSLLYPVKQVVTEVKTKINDSVAIFDKPARLLASPEPNLAVSSPSPTRSNTNEDIKGVVKAAVSTNQPISSAKIIHKDSEKESAPSTLPTFEAGASEIEVQSIITVAKPTATPASEVKPSIAAPGSPHPILEVPAVQLDGGPVQVELNPNIKGPPTVHL